MTLASAARPALEALAELLDGRPFVALVGAGCSTESGIPDYRGPESRRTPVRPIMFQDFVRSADTRARYWARSAVGWRRVADARPNPAHVALAELEERGPLEGVITQNVDGLHARAGSRRVVELHGSLASVRCLGCGAAEARESVQERMLELNPAWAEHVRALEGTARAANGAGTGEASAAVPAETSAPASNPDGDADLPEALTRGFRVPDCEACGGVLKPDVVFFGETVPAPVVEAAWKLYEDGEALLVLGSSLTVYSGRRFVDRAAKDGRPVAVVNLGPTRADDRAAVRVEGRVGDLLPRLARRLGATASALGLGLALGTTGPAIAAVSAIAAMVPSAASAQGVHQLEESRRLQGEGIEAYRAGDIATFAARTDSALQLRPDHPALVYNLAAARALADDPAGAVDLLGRLADWGLAYDPAADDDFASLRNAPAFEAVRRRLLANREPRGNASRAFELADERMLPEALAHDPATGTFFLSSVRHRSIARIAGPTPATSAISATPAVAAVTAFVKGAATGLPAPLGMVADPGRRALWVSGSTMEESESADPGQAPAEVREYDLDTGALRRVLAVPSADMQTGDVALDGRGGVLVSDGRTGALLRSSTSSDSLTIVLPAGTLGSPQGIVVTDEGRSAWVADYALGLVRVDLEARTAVIVRAPTTLLGSDGLLAHGPDLIVIQNGIAPARVLRLSPSGDGKRIESFEVLLASHPDFAEPTGAVIAGGRLYLVANSQWPRFTGGEVSRPEDLVGPIVLDVEF